MLRIPKPDGGEEGAMRSESTAEGDESERRTPMDAVAVQLTAALDGAETQETRYHLRQALQLVEAVEELE